jgi:hypothetical protein
MAAPNVVNVATITAKTTYSTPSSNTANVLLANDASSGKVFKINMIMATNIDGTDAVDTTVAINTDAAGSGNSFPIASTISVPADAALIVIDKSTAFYLEEDKSIVVTSGISDKITYTVSYEEIS